jgi:hypothetical protein
MTIAPGRCRRDSDSSMSSCTSAATASVGSSAGETFAVIDRSTVSDSPGVRRCAVQTTMRQLRCHSTTYSQATPSFDGYCLENSPDSAMCAAP